MIELVRTAYDVLEVAIPIAMLPVLARLHRPHVALGWWVPLLVLPILGLLAWFVLGFYRPRRRQQRESVMRELDQLRPVVRPEEAETDLGPDLDPLARLVRQLGMHRLGGWPVVGGNRVTVLDERGAFMDRLVEDVAAARHSVDLLFYMVSGDATGRRLAEALLEAAARGVRCRVLAGAFSSHWEASEPFFDAVAPRLEAGGVEVRSLRPLSPLRSGLSRFDLRNHRKLAVLDGGAVGYAGSENVHDPDMGLDEGIWHQMSLRLAGPAARQLQLVFLHDWILHGGTCGDLPEPPAAPDAADGVAAQVLWWGPADDAPAVKVLLAILGAARAHVTVVTPYFVPDRPVLLALVTAGLRGVEVDLIVPGRSDMGIADAAGRAVFGELLEAGVRIHLHPTGVLHAKCMSVDDRVALVGSANGDRRSFYLDEEVAVLLYDPAVARRVRERQEAWQKESEPLDREALAARPLWRRTADDLAGLASPLL